MVKVQGGKAAREAVPAFLLGLAAESLLELSWTDPALGVQPCAWWPEESGDGPLPDGMKWGTETLTLDLARKVVIVTHASEPLSAEELAVIATQWAQRIAARRYLAETSGTTVNGMPIDTDDRSKLLINGAVVEAMIDPSYTLAWKTSAGSMPLTGSQVISIGRAVRAHVQACFDREAALLDAVTAGTITNAMLDTGWPT